MSMAAIASGIVVVVGLPIALGAGLARYLLSGEGVDGEGRDESPAGLNALHLWHHAMRCVRQAPRRIAGPDA